MKTVERNLKISKVIQICLHGFRDNERTGAFSFLGYTPKPIRYRIRQSDRNSYAHGPPPIVMS